MKADKKIEDAVMDVLDKFTQGYEYRDLDLLRSIFAPDTDVVLYGTGGDEKRIGLEEICGQFQRDFHQSEATSMNFNWVSVSASGHVAWLASDARWDVRVGGKDISFDARVTMVFEKREENWLIVQFHCSLPTEDQEEGQSIPM